MSESSLKQVELKAGERFDDLQRNGYEIIQDPERFCFGMDAVLLSGFATVKKGGTLIDLGTGTGILPILLSAKTEGRHFTGLEIQPESVDMARRSVIHNRLEDRIDIVEGDIREARSLFSAASFDTVVSNPPYMIRGSGIVNPEAPKAIARHEILCTLQDVISAASYLLKPGGALFMVHRPCRLPDIFEEMRRNKLEPKRMRLVYPGSGKAPDMVLLEGRKGGNPELKCEKPLIIFGEDGKYTSEITEVYGY
ncbi:MAG: tRNA1(Val) (adenine(37)-N6)-methyltransferase [Lachnospiraceae bacterium]|nr:tRNA1(Val) (adenine(37)-N6)-methyltransferase [Lachnospiraceae bacterium]